MTWPVEPLSNLWSSLSREKFSADPLDGDQQVDIAIVGGGIGGLATALTLAQGGADVAVLEAQKFGHGATGRSNGQIIPTLTRHDPDAILRVYGVETGERFLTMLERSADILYNTVKRYDIDCDAVRAGWMQLAHSPGRLKVTHRRAQQWIKRGNQSRLLDRHDVAQRLGSDVYCGGWLHEGGGHLNPLALAQGLARAAVSEGASVYEQTPVLSLQRQGDVWHLSTPTGTVFAKRVVLATAAYTGDLWPGLAREIVPVLSYQLATRPLNDEAAAQILPFNHAMSDTRMDLRYIRKDREGRLIAGGALAFQYNSQERLTAMISDNLGQVFPEYDWYDFEFFWSGRIAMTLDRLPRLHRSDDGLIAWIGCNGRGLALSMGLAQVMADAVLGVADDRLALPPSKLSAIPLHALVRRFARLALVYYRYKDTREV